MISKKTTDYESEAKQASKKCSEYRNRSLNAKETIDGVLSKIEESLVNINSMNEAISKTYATIDEIGQLAITNKNDIDAVEERIESLNLLYESRDSLDEKLDDLTTLADDAEDKSSKFNAVYNLLLKRKKEIDDLYYEINGYEVENEEAEEPVYIEGIKGMLEKTYTQVENNLKDLEKTIEKTIEKTHEESTESYEEFIKSSE